MDLTSPYIIAPVWALVSTQLFLQGLLATVNLVVAVTAVMRGIIPARNFMAATIASCLSALVFFALLLIGFYVVAVRLPDWQTLQGQWIYAGMSFVCVLIMVPRLWGKIRAHWRLCMMPGAGEIDAALGKSEE